MTLTARTTSGETVCISMFGSAADLYKKHPYGTLISPYPDCDGFVSGRFRYDFPPHFFHHTEPLTGYANSHYPDHDMGKLILAGYLEEAYEEPIQYEVLIGDRMVDVVCGIGSVQIAGEVQFCPITTDQIQERSLNIIAMGFNPIWMLGGPANTEANRAWCDENLCSFYTVDLERSEEELLIH